MDCVNANSLVTEDESTNKDGSQDIAAKPQDSMKSGTALSNRSSPTQDVKAIDREASNEKDIFHSVNYPSYAASDIIGKSWYSFARLSADIFSFSSRLSSLYYEQFLQFEKACGYYWTEAYKSFNMFSQRNRSHNADVI